MNTTFGTVGGKPNVTYLQPPSAQTMFNNPQQSMFGNAPQQPMGTFPSMGQQPLGMGQQPLGMGRNVALIRGNYDRYGVSRTLRRPFLPRKDTN